MRVSILINNFNHRDFLGQAIESALAQSWPDTEVIVVDDGSTDQSPDVIRSYAGRVAVIEQLNSGQGAAYNTGFRVSTGRVLILLDSDDLLDQNAAERVLKSWHDGVSKVQFRLRIIDRNGTPTGRVIPTSLNGSDALTLVRLTGGYGSPPGSGNAYARSMLEQVMPVDEPRWRRAADTVPILAAPLLGEVVSIEEPLGSYRVHGGTESHRFFLNNAAKSPAREIAIIEQRKDFARELLRRYRPDLAQFDMQYTLTEARVATIAYRFGGSSGKDVVSGESISLKKILKSVIGWPNAHWTTKTLVLAWMVLVLLLPRPLAMRVGMLNSRNVGLRV